MNYLELTQLSQFKFDRHGTIKIKSGNHYKGLLGKISFEPITKAQASRHIKEIEKNGADDLLMVGEWVGVEFLLNSYGFEGIYKLTKSKNMCRLVNYEDYVCALKEKFRI